MKIEDALRGHLGADYPAETKAIVERLDSVRKAAGDQLDLTRDPTRAIAKDKRDNLIDSRDEEIPDEFKDWVREYYRALSEP